MNDIDTIKGMLRAAVYGEAVGDALGVPYEFQRRGSFSCTGMRGYGSHNRPAGTWSDDTALMLATLDSLSDCGGRVNTSDMLSRFRSWIGRGAYTPDGVIFDIGGTTASALGSGHGMTGEMDNGNGSLMRILPLAFVDCTDGDVRAASAVTHAHRTSTECCVRFVRAARMLMAGRFDVSELSALAGTNDLRTVPREDVRSGTYVLDTLHAALWCLVTTDSYRDCVLAAVNLGSDTDTTAAVVGGLAGIRYGLDANPWTGELRGSDLVDALLNKASTAFDESGVWVR